MGLRWGKNEEIALLERSIEALKDVIKGYQEENKLLLEMFKGGAPREIVIDPGKLVAPLDEELLAGTFVNIEESKDGSDR